MSKEELLKNNYYLKHNGILLSEQEQLDALNEKTIAIKYFFNPSAAVQLKALRRNCAAAYSINNLCEEAKLYLAHNSFTVALDVIKNPSKEVIEILSDHGEGVLPTCFLESASEEVIQYYNDLVDKQQEEYRIRMEKLNKIITVEDIIF